MDDGASYLRASKLQLLALCAIGTLSNIYGLWNEALVVGLGYQIIFNVSFAIAFVFYSCCTSELISTFPFPGGCYGLARCTVGFFPGFLVGCCEIFYYVLVFSVNNAGLAQYVNLIAPNTTDYFVLILLVLYAVQLGLCYSKRVFWWTMVVFATVTLVINCCFLFGAIRYLNFNRWALSPVHDDAGDDASTLALAVDDDFDPTAAHYTGRMSLFVGTPLQVIQAFPTAVWIYMGSELINLTVDDCKHPRKEIPFAQIVVIGMTVVLNIIVPIFAAGLSPGTRQLIGQLSPTAPGFARVFGISNHMALCLEFPGIFGYCVGACYSLSKLLSAMADSRLFPTFLGRRLKSSNVAFNALVTSCILAILAIIIPAFGGRDLFTVWLDVGGIINLLVYCVQLVGYFVMKLKLANFTKEFTSPFGLIGAGYALIMFALAMITTLTRAFALATAVVTVVLLLLVGLLYHCYSSKRQIFSDAEKEVMLPAHVAILDVNAFLYSRFVWLGKIMGYLYPQSRNRSSVRSNRRVVPVAVAPGSPSPSPPKPEVMMVLSNKNLINQFNVNGIINSSNVNNTSDSWRWHRQQHVDVLDQMAALGWMLVPSTVGVDNNIGRDNPYFSVSRNDDVGGVGGSSTSPFPAGWQLSSVAEVPDTVGDNHNDNNVNTNNVIKSDDAEDAYLDANSVPLFRPSRKSKEIGYIVELPPEMDAATATAGSSIKVTSGTSGGSGARQESQSQSQSQNDSNVKFSSRK